MSYVLFINNKKKLKILKTLKKKKLLALTLLSYCFTEAKSREKNLQLKKHFVTSFTENTIFKGFFFFISFLNCMYSTYILKCK